MVWSVQHWKKLRHALLFVWGYNLSNSWGNGDWAQYCTHIMENGKYKHWTLRPKFANNSHFIYDIRNSHFIYVIRNSNINSNIYSAIVHPAQGCSIFDGWDPQAPTMLSSSICEPSQTEYEESKCPPLPSAGWSIFSLWVAWNSGLYINGQSLWFQKSQ